MALLELAECQGGVLSQYAASATVEFDYSKISTNRDTLSGRGAWTYVLKKYDADQFFEDLEVGYALAEHCHTGWARLQKGFKAEVQEEGQGGNSHLSNERGSYYSAPNYHLRVAIIIL